MADLAAMDVLDVWYARLDDSDYLAMLPKRWRAAVQNRIAKTTTASSAELVYPKPRRGGLPRIRDNPPKIFHVDATEDAGDFAIVQQSLAQYRETLPDDRRVLLDRYTVVDIAIKVVGIGSVGTNCLVALLISAAAHPFFLQVKEANASVFEAHAGKSAYSHHGERVVQGQRLMQPATDLFLGWVTSPDGRHYYIVSCVT